MEHQALIIENLKCGGCVKTVTKLLEGIEGISAVTVKAETGEVEFDYSGETSTVQTAREKLAAAGYPPEGEGNLWLTAKSYVSCAKGKMSN